MPCDRHLATEGLVQRMRLHFGVRNVNLAIQDGQSGLRNPIQVTILSPRPGMRVSSWLCEESTAKTYVPRSLTMLSIGLTLAILAAADEPAPVVATTYH